MHVSAAQRSDLSFGVMVHAGRFAVIMLALWVAPALGIGGWYMGLFVNIVCCAYAVALVSYYRLWHVIGVGVPWRGRTAALLLLVPLAEALMWVLPRGLVEQPPGWGLWALTLLLVGFNEELISRGVVLNRLRRSFSAYPAVILTAALFGLQHLSAFATTGRGTWDILSNVAVSACYGFALAAFQYRFAWIWPLMLIHALADFTTILARDQHGDAVVVITLMVFIGFGVALLRFRPAEATLPTDTPDGERASSGHPHPG